MFEIISNIKIKKKLNKNVNGASIINVKLTFSVQSWFMKYTPKLVVT